MQNHRLQRLADLQRCPRAGGPAPRQQLLSSAPPRRRWSASGADLGGRDGALFRFLAASKRSVVGGPADAEVQRYGTHALGHLAGTDANRGRIAEAGGVEAVVAALGAHLEHAKVRCWHSCGIAGTRSEPKEQQEI